MQFFSQIFGSAISASGDVSQQISNITSQQQKAIEDRIQIEENLPNIDDIISQKNSYNENIPIVFGEAKFAGNIIWTGKLTSEVKQTNGTTIKKVFENSFLMNSFDLKGAPEGQGILNDFSAWQNTDTEFVVTQYVDFAIAICEGEVDEVFSIQANGIELDLSKYKHRIYLGTKNQQTDPLIVSHKGIKNTPAFRGICYIVFENFPLHAFGKKIPNLLFSVRKSTAKANLNSINQLVEGITLIPGTGEFVYHSEKITKYTVKALRNGGEAIVENSKQAMNFNNNTEKSNVMLALDNLKNQMPNIKWISVVVCWFANSLDIQDCEIYPACEFNDYNMTTSPYIWSVAGKSRWQSKVIMKDENNNALYGGTPSDNSVISLLQELKNRGYKITLTPMIMVENLEKPWRGRITGDVLSVSEFFHKENGYNNFIKHYAELCKNYIDVLVIGTEMIGLTKIRNMQNNIFPAVDEFCNLAVDVREIVGSNVKLTYGADWSEYHHTDGGFYNMDKLWANSNIDFIGIDAYFPLTDTNASALEEEVMNGWNSGEGYDFVYNQDRSQKLPIEARWAWKNIRYFVENYHINADGLQTQWQPNMKKIWFMEYGFPSVDLCTNQPNVFYDPSSSESNFPRKSSGNIDFQAQNIAIVATEKYWKQNNDIVENKFLWTWDARPYPFFPRLDNIWSDSKNWQYGHWINGKAMNAFIVDIILHLMNRAKIINFQEDIISGIINGMVLKGSMNIKNVLENLSILYNFKIFEKNGKVFAKEFKNLEKFIIDKNEILIDENVKEILDSASNRTNFIKNLKMYFYDVDKNSIMNYVTAVDMEHQNGIEKTISMPIMISLYQAQEIANKAIMVLNSVKIRTIALPTLEKYQEISAGNIIQFLNEDYLGIAEEVTKTQSRIIVKIVETTPALLEILKNIPKYDVQNQKIETMLPEILPEMQILDINNFRNIEDEKNTFSLHFAFSNIQNEGAVLYYSTDNKTFKKMFTVIQNSTTGIVSEATNFQTNRHTKDRKNKISIYIKNNGEILDENGICIIGNEIIRFESFRKNDDEYEISNLMRGIYDTQFESNFEGKRFVLLDDFVRKFSFAKSINKIYFKLVPNSQNLNDITSVEFVPEKNSSKFWSVKKIRRKSMESGIAIEWFYQNFTIQSLFEVSRPNLHTFEIDLDGKKNIVYGKNSYIFTENIPIENLNITEI